MPVVNPTKNQVVFVFVLNPTKSQVVLNTHTYLAKRGWHYIWKYYQIPSCYFSPTFSVIRYHVYSNNYNRLLKVAFLHPLLTPHFLLSFCWYFISKNNTHSFSWHFWVFTSCQSWLHGINQNKLDHIMFFFKYSWSDFVF